MVVKVATGLLRLVGFAVEVVTALASFTFSPTEAIIEVTPTRVSALNLDRTVHVVSLQEGMPGEVVLQPGEGTNIELGKPPTPASPWSAERVDRVKQATYLPWEGIGPAEHDRCAHGLGHVGEATALCSRRRSPARRR
jgi:hypothetical protein